MEKLSLEVCQDCGKTYQATKHTHYCEECRRKRQSQIAKERKLNLIGNKAYRERAKARKAQVAKLMGRTE